MDPSIWSCLPFKVLELVFQWLPLSVVIKFGTVCKKWKNALQKPSLFLRCKNVSTNEFGFLIPFLNSEDNCFSTQYLNQNGHIYQFHLGFIVSRYRVECIVGPMVVLSLPTKCSQTHNYFVTNPFTKAFKNIGPIRIRHHLIL